MQQAVCVRRKKNRGGKKNTKKSTPPKTHHEIHSSPATATTSTRRATKHVTHVSPYSPASIDPGFVEIGFVQLSQSVKTANVTHTQTDGQSNEAMAPCTHPGMKRLFCLWANNSVASLSRPCLITMIEVNEARRPHAAGRVRSKKKRSGKKTRKNPPHPKQTTKSTATRRPRPPRDGAQ